MTGPATHRPFSASAAERWLTCGASVVVDTSGLRTGVAAAAATRGTNLHAEAERRLRNATVGEILGEGDEEAIAPYVTYVRALWASGARVLLEHSSDLVPGLCGGTADAVALHRTGMLEVVDLKTGYHLVSPRQNAQLGIYALGLLEKFDPVFDATGVRLTICQPEPRSWDTTPEELRAGLGRQVLDQVRAVISGRAEFHPTEDACRWCAARSICPALTGLARQAAADDFTDEALAEWTSETTPGDGPDLAQRMEVAVLVRLWADAVEADLRARLVGGLEVPGWKVVRGRAGNRGWVNSNQAAAYAARHGVDPFEERTVLTPAALEKLAKRVLGKDGAVGFLAGLKEHVRDGAPGRPTVTRESDSRPAVEVGSLAADDFAEVLDP